MDSNYPLFLRRTFQHYVRMVRHDLFSCSYTDVFIREREGVLQHLLRKRAVVQPSGNRLQDLAEQGIAFFSEK